MIETDKWSEKDIEREMERDNGEGDSVRKRERQVDHWTDWDTKGDGNKITEREGEQDTKRDRGQEREIFLLHQGSQGLTQVLYSESLIHCGDVLSQTSLEI